jgi:ABC-2 type transport system permease protein
MMGILMSAYTNTSSSVYISKFQGNIQEWLVAPLSYWQVIFGLTLAAILRALLVGAGITVVGLFFAPLPLQNVLVILYFAVLVSLLFSFAGIATGLWAANFDQVNVFATFIITPLTYLGGIFYSIHQLPPFWKTIAQFNPIFYLVDGFRYGFLGRSDLSVWWSMLLLLILTVLFFLLSVQLLKKRYKLRS